MSKKQIQIEPPLFTIEKSDIEALRVNKNKNREFFFLKDEITEEDQEKWYQAFQEREDDHMFVCKESGKVFGCMGFRLFENKVDAYNIMRFCESSYSIKFCFSKMLEAAKIEFPEKKIQVRVLKTNPAISWYESLGFEHALDETNFVTLYYKH